MTRNQKLLWGGLGVLALLVACCVGTVLGSALMRDRIKAAPSTPAGPRGETAVPKTIPPATSTPASVTFTSEPTPTNTRVVQLPVETPTASGVTPATPGPTPTRVPEGKPTGPAGDLKALAAYAEAIKPILDQGLAAAQRDGQVLEASKGNQEALCGGARTPHPILVADATLMRQLAKQLNEITPPPEAAGPVHQPLKESLNLWGDALDNINLSCQEDPNARGLLRLGATLQLGGSLLNFRIASDNFWRLVLMNGIEAIVGTPPAQ